MIDKYVCFLFPYMNENVIVLASCWRQIHLNLKRTWNHCVVVYQTLLPDRSSAVAVVVVVESTSVGSYRTIASEQYSHSNGYSELKSLDASCTLFEDASSYSLLPLKESVLWS